MSQSVGNTPPTHSRENSDCTTKASKRAKLPVLARICDDIRAAIRGYRPPGPWPHLSELSSLISAFLQDEEMPSMHINFETIKACRLDKLLEDILNPKHHPRRPPKELCDLVANARTLQEKWSSRFGQEYCAMDEMRSSELKQTGLLKDLYFEVEDGNPGWRIRKGRGLSGDAVTNTSLEPGQWFINMACAYRSGMSGTSIETLAKNGVKILPLLWGNEEHSERELTRYTREGDASEMAHSLLSQVGQRVHVLRGHRLRSPYSPEAGIRYDGIYIIRSFGLKLDPHTDTYRMSLTMEQAPGQERVEALQLIPRPSQLDDWQLYQKVEECEIQRTGVDEFETWRAMQKGDRVVF
ncbi:hypothetical protein jhhlp_001944 [Lomentospora prolificans]|uniref:YDG domain-containing protein n=1 Tax=Lomentospora prolificans TaxID=41688 RepID=A0A2N3NCL3_9PEZI|nr:hypothetical protein jhhlp_001944 [Lomentospora prolificans]